MTRPMIPRMPPASWMLLIFSVNEHVPRSTNTILPASDPAGNGGMMIGGLGSGCVITGAAANALHCARGEDHDGALDGS